MNETIALAPAMRDHSAKSPASSMRGRVTRRRAIFFAAALFVLCGLLWFSYHWWTIGKYFETTDDAYVGGDVTVIAPKVAGFIAAVAVIDNQSIHAGDLLIKLDDRDYRAALARAEAEVAGKQATLDNLDATRRLQLTLIAQARAGVSAAQAESIRAHADQIRFQQLSSHAAASLQSFQKADADYKEALAGGLKARAAVEAAERQVDVIDTQKRQTEAALAAALADRDTARLNLSYTELRAPIDGTVGNRSAHLGAYATVGAQLLSIVPARGLWIDANFKESQLTQMRPGQTVSIEADVMPGKVLHGHVASLAPATGAQFSVLPAENATGNFTKIVQRVPVRIVLDGDAATLQRLRPGLSVTAAVDQRDPLGQRLTPTQRDATAQRAALFPPDALAPPDATAPHDAPAPRDTATRAP